MTDRAEPATAPRRVVVITGMSGAGKTQALKAFEDFGYEAVDNLPLSLLAGLVFGGEQAPRHVAIGVDGRTRDFSAERFWAAVEPLVARGGLVVTVLFLDCDEDVLVRRYTETRRRHPLAPDRPVLDGIALERWLMSSIRERADLLIDTTRLSERDLKTQLAARFAADDSAGLVVALVSFSYRNGLPREADLVFDVRFLANPHWVEALRPGTGLDAPVGAHIAADPSYGPFFGRVADLVTSLLPLYEREGKSYLTIAVGCTGGRHRSVYTVERLAERLGEGGWRTLIQHREIGASIRNPS